MGRNIMHELYGPDARKNEKEMKNKENEKEEESQESSGSETENIIPVKSPDTQLICPKCKGARIKHIITKIYGSTPQRYICEDCGYIGSLILDVSEREKSELDIAMEEDLMKIKKELGL